MYSSNRTRTLLVVPVTTKSARAVSAAFVFCAHSCSDFLSLERYPSLSYRPIPVYCILYLLVLRECVIPCSLCCRHTHPAQAMICMICHHHSTCCQLTLEHVISGFFRLQQRKSCLHAQFCERARRIDSYFVDYYPAVARHNAIDCSHIASQ